jgi:hypothetical protein
VHYGRLEMSDYVILVRYSMQKLSHFVQKLYHSVLELYPFVLVAWEVAVALRSFQGSLRFSSTEVARN